MVTYEQIFTSKTILLLLIYFSMVKFRAGEPANILAAPALDFFFKRLRLLIFSQAAPASAPGFFFKRLRLQFQGAKNTRLLTIG